MERTIIGISLAAQAVDGDRFANPGAPGDGDASEQIDLPTRRRKDK
jgi:hypothetical protein